MDFLGAPYPIVSDPRGYLHTQGGNAQIKSDLLCLLLTNPGERIFLPQFGTPLNTVMFEPNTPALQNKVRNMIIAAITQWEPRVAVQSIQVTNQIPTAILNPADDKTNLENILSISIVFSSFDNISQLDQLQIDLPVAGT